MIWHMSYKNLKLKIGKEFLFRLIFLILGAIFLVRFFQYATFWTRPNDLVRLDPQVRNVNIVLVCSLFSIFLFVEIPFFFLFFGLAVFTGFGFIHAMKIQLLEEPLFIFDLLYFRHLPVLIKYLPLWFKVVLIGFVFLSINLFFSKRRPKKQAKSSTLAERCIIGSLVAVGLFIYCEATEKTRFLNKTFTYAQWDPITTIGQAGFFITQLKHLQYINVHTPTHYSKDAITSILAQPSAVQAKTEVTLPAPHSEIPPKTALPTPKVVVILLESFWDPSHAGLTFKKDPIPFWRSLATKYGTTPYLSPNIGGGTANSEFEVLTGLSLAFLPAGAIPYQQYVRTELPSIVKIFRHAGYHTIAIHNFIQSFWSRNRVYPVMGFDQFVSLETLRNWKPKGTWIEDRHVFEYSLNELTKSEKQFQFLITMDTHGPYPENPDDRKTWLDNTADFGEGIGTYLAKIHRLDENLQWYFSELKKLSNPPLVVLFGDHQPSITGPTAWGEQIHEGIQNKKRIEALVIHPDLKLSTTKGIPAIKAQERALYCLSSQIIERVGFPLPPFFQKVESFCNQVPRLTREMVGQSPMPAQLSEMHLLHYDRLFGFQYSADKTVITE
jgi:phosphoglycerol transferase MdoB-like AlkP superfamily enzyme